MSEISPLNDEAIERITAEVCHTIVQRIGPRDEASFNRCYVTVLSAVANLAATSFAAPAGKADPARAS